MFIKFMKGALQITLKELLCQHLRSQPTSRCVPPEILLDGSTHNSHRYFMEMVADSELAHSTKFLHKTSTPNQQTNHSILATRFPTQR